MSDPVTLMVGLGLAGAGLSAGQGYLSGKRADKAQKRSEKLYNQMSLPNEQALNAQAIQNRGQLAQDRLSAYKNAANSLAARGFGSGSGLGLKAAGDIESGYLQALGKQATELTKFSKTRQFAPNQDVYGYSVPGAFENALGSGNSMLNTTLGMYMAKKMLDGSMNPGPSDVKIPGASYGYNPYEINNMGY